VLSSSPAFSSFLTTCSTISSTACSDRSLPRKKSSRYASWVEFWESAELAGLRGTHQLGQRFHPRHALRLVRVERRRSRQLLDREVSKMPRVTGRDVLLDEAFADVSRDVGDPRVRSDGGDGEEEGPVLVERVGQVVESFAADKIGRVLAWVNLDGAVCASALSLAGGLAAHTIS